MSGGIPSFVVDAHRAVGTGVADGFAAWQHGNPDLTRDLLRQGLELVSSYLELRSEELCRQLRVTEPWQQHECFTYGSEAFAERLAICSWTHMFGGWDG